MIKINKTAKDVNEQRSKDLPRFIFFRNKSHCITGNNIIGKEVI